MNIDTHEIKRRILAEFDDKETENVFATLDAILVNPSGELAELATFCAALTDMVASGVIVLGFERKSFSPEIILDRGESLNLAAELPSWFKFEIDEKLWTLSKGEFGVDPIPTLILTKEGAVRAIEVREKFGFRWWDRLGSHQES